MANGTDKVPELLDAIAVVDGAIALAEGALHDNPSLAEERALNRTLLRLNAQRAALEAELDAALAGSTLVQGPSDAQLAQIAALSEEVELATNAAATVSARIALTTKVLTLASSVLAPKPKPA